MNSLSDDFRGADLSESTVLWPPLPGWCAALGLPGVPDKFHHCAGLTNGGERATGDRKAGAELQIRMQVWSWTERHQERSAAVSAAGRPTGPGAQHR